MVTYDLDLIESARQDSNLRPSAPKAQEIVFDRIIRTIGITKY